MGKIIAVVGARPNFMKMSPVIKSLIPLGLKPIIVHTGQHYDEKMSQEILSDLEFEKPNYFLKAGGGTGTQQTSRIMKRFEKICKLENPILVIVAGDVNSTLACALVAVKMRIKIAHIESGLRSFDMEMPEEINRILTDRISDFLFTTEKNAGLNLQNEGIDMKKVYFAPNWGLSSEAMVSDYIKQTPGCLGIWNNIKYTLDPHAADYLVIQDQCDKELMNLFEVHQRLYFSREAVRVGGFLRIKMLEKDH